MFVSSIRKKSVRRESVSVYLVSEKKCKCVSGIGQNSKCVSGIGKKF